VAGQRYWDMPPPKLGLNGLSREGRHRPAGMPCSLEFEHSLRSILYGSEYVVGQSQTKVEAAARERIWRARRRQRKPSGF
jgi:hypothetical protein